MLGKVNYFFDRKIAPGFRLKRNHLVIDIGSGDKPFWRGNVFLDKLELGNLHRHTDSKTVRKFGVFVNSDITKTKFKNKAFDFSFCAHLLEHVERPDLAIKEIVRISKKGYIEVPNGVIEYIHPFHSHIWFILQDHKKLIFVRKSKKIHESLLKNSKTFPSLVNQIREPFIRIYWNNKVEFEIIDTEKRKYYPPKSTPKSTKNLFFSKLGNSIYLTLVLILRKMYGVSDKVELNDLLK